MSLSSPGIPCCLSSGLVNRLATDESLKSRTRPGSADGNQSSYWSTRARFTQWFRRLFCVVSGCALSARTNSFLPTGARSFAVKALLCSAMERSFGGGDVIFGEPGDSALLGARTLEALGPSLDPLRRELRPLQMILGGWRVRLRAGLEQAAQLE